MKTDFWCTELTNIVRQMTSKLSLQEILHSITQGLVNEFNASFVRIWQIGAGDSHAAHTTTYPNGRFLS